MTDLAKQPLKGYDNLSTPTLFNDRNLHPIARSFTTNILIVGGAYSGLSALRSLQLHLAEQIQRFKQEQPSTPIKKLTLTIVEPRNGLLNILGIPKSIVDSAFARTQFIPFKDLNNCKFANIFSDTPDEYDISWFGDDNKWLDINYVHGRVTYLDQHKAQYTLGSPVSEKAIIEFDYVILATGRDRNWPTTPLATTYGQYMLEMDNARQEIANADTISVIGAGAVGIEFAGDIKTEFPHKTVNLIHPHECFPQEPLSNEFKRLTQDSLERAGANVYLNTRIRAESIEKRHGDLTTTNNKTIHSNLNIWSCSKHNNIGFLSQHIYENFVTSNKNISINQYLQLYNAETNTTIENFFVLGDLVELPIIKSAGWAMYMGRQVANNLSNLIFNGIFVEPFPDLNAIPYGMVIVGGNNEIISELAGEVEVDNEHYKQEYEDYCIGKIRATIDM